MINTYDIEETAANEFTFFNDKGLEYHIVMEGVSCHYQKSDGVYKSLELFNIKLEDQSYAQSSDYKTRNTIGYFFKTYLMDKPNDAFMFMIHNAQEEAFESRRRGIGRLRLYKRIARKFSQLYETNIILLTNSPFIKDPKNLQADFIGILAKTECEDYNAIIQAYNQYCYEETYVKT